MIAHATHSCGMQHNDGKAQAITYSRFGGPDVLTLSEVDIPQPGEGQTRIRVRAAGVNPIDIKIRRGDFGGAFPAHPITPGLDAAGTVELLGAGATDIEVGDEVLGIALGGSYAQYAILGAPVRKPTAMSWEFAASLPTVGEAAFRALKHLDLVSGETLLIHGAAGSVGSVAAQLARARGIKVIGSVGPADEDSVRSLGAVPVRYGDGLAERVRAVAPHGISAVLDTAGRGVLPVSIELAGGPQRVITIADMDAAKYGVRFTGSDPSDRAPEALGQLVDLAAVGALSVAIWRSYPLARAAEAHAEIEAGANHGKIVLIP
jgi:NADPH:quinone reductase-like Zn-dependent oxidoreductase